jgi:rhodanese-related sulfurtransferase
MNWQRMVMVLIVAGLLAACGVQPAAPAVSGVRVPVEGGTYTNVTPAQLAEMLNSKDFFFVNTHIPYEGEIVPTDARVPFDQTARQLDTYPADKSAKIVVYCRSGRMSDIAARELVQAGYTNVWNLDGGMIAWEQAGYTIIKK